MMKSKLLSTVLLLALCTTAAHAQPRAASPDAYGDRQTGRFGDPGEGNFGDPSKGNFDDASMKEPPPGTEPQGKVYRKSVAGNAEILSKMNAEVAAAEPAAAPATPKKRLAKRKKSRK